MNGSSNRIHMDGLRLRAGTLTWAGFPVLKRFRKGIVAVSGEIALLQCAKPPPQPSPASAGLSREKSHIDELQLIAREFGFWFAGIDWRRLVDFRDRNSREKALANEFGEAQVQHPQGIQSPGEAQEQIGDHRSDDLQTNGVVVLAHELAKIEMLLDPAEQEFNLPATFIESRNLDCRAFEIIGDESNHSAFGTLDPDAPQWNRQTGIALAGEHDIGIVDDFKAVADGLA